MKKVAIIGADFTPSSLPPALRIRFFAQHLPEFGWEPIIIATDAKHYEQDIDPENENLLPPTLEIIRTEALALRLSRKLGVGEIGIRSIWHQWRALSVLCQERKIDLLFIPVPPSISMIIGRLAYHRFGIPYVIDYIDPWVTDYYRTLPKGQRPPKWFFAATLARILEPISLKYVRHIIGVSKGTTDTVVQRYPWLTEADATDIPYGGDDRDLKYVQTYPRQNNIFNPRDGLLHLSYIGAYTEAMQPTLRAVFASLRSGLCRKPELFKRIRLHFVGTTYSSGVDAASRIMPIARELGVDKLIDEHQNRVAYLDALQLVLDSHALLVLGSDTPHYTASKIFPYILAQKPLLAVFHEESSVVTILKETQTGRVITFNSRELLREKVEDISRQIEELLLTVDDYVPSTRWDVFEPYTTRALTARLAQTFDKALIENG